MASSLMASWTTRTDAGANSLLISRQRLGMTSAITTLASASHTIWTQRKRNEGNLYRKIVKEIKNTRHSSGLGVNTKNINQIEHDECPDESSGTRQGITYLVIKTLEHEYDEWWVKCKTKLKKTLHSTPMPFKSLYANHIHGCRVGVEWWRDSTPSLLASIQ